VILFLHNRYRTTGGEERVVEELVRLVRDELDEPAELLARDSSELGRGRALVGLIGGGLQPGDVARAVRLSGARVIHAHNLHPTLGWRALAAGRAAGARIVLHLHQYRLVCAIGVCFTRGADCTRCHGRDTTPGVRLNCRGSMPEAVAYGAALALWQRRLVAQADEVLVPSVFARERLRALGAPLPWSRVRVLPPPVPEPPVVSEARGGYALVVSRLAAEKGVDVAIDACRLAGIPLLIAGDGPEWGRLRERVRGADVRFLGRVGGEDLDRLRAQAAIGLFPSRAPETFGMALAEAMAAGVPVAASDMGAHAELLERDALVQVDNARALAAAIERRAGDRAAGERGRVRVRELCAPERVAEGLSAIYDGRRPGSSA
jgi:glycosyltransferase involved in cell wall biosynthesis